jgi:hypothetical protein
MSAITRIRLKFSPFLHCTTVSNCTTMFTVHSAYARTSSSEFSHETPLLNGSCGSEINVWNCMEYALDRKFDLFVPRNEAVHHHSQFLHSCVCKQLIYSQDRSAFWLQKIGSPHILYMVLKLGDRTL